MNFFNKLSLKNKIFISCLGFILVVSVVIALFTRWLLISSLTKELIQRGTGIAQSIADNARVYMLTKNKAELTSISYDARLGNRKNIVRYLIVSDKDGNILAHSFTTYFPDRLKKIVKNQKHEEQSIESINISKYPVFHVSVPVKEGLYTIGSVQVGLDKQHIERLISNLRLLFFSFLSAVTVVFFFISHQLARHITKPVSSLIKYTDLLTKGNLNIVSENDFSHDLTGELVRVPTSIGSSEDEIGKLTDSFIKMASKIRTSTQKLMGSEKKYRSLFTAGPNPIFVINRKTFKALDANQKAMELFGYKREELLKMNFFTMGNLEPEKFVRDYPEGKSIVISSKVKFYKKDGSSVFINIHASPAEYREEDVLIVAATDITELVEKDSQLIQASKMTNLEEMSAGIAHEINQPLNAIKMGSEYLVMMKEKNKQVAENDFNMVLEEISSQVSRATEIINRLKKFSRKADFTREVININNCIRSVHKIIGRQIALQNIDLNLELDESIPSVLAHNNRIEQVIFNLVTNAKDAVFHRIENSMDLSKGEITISTFHDKENVAIVISDNGAGIKTQELDKIFESFYTTKEIGEGMGLGLPIIQGIVKDYNGTISVDSKEGKGTSFKILFSAYLKKG
ncbi:MAG: PAS domain S-box protein [Desulfobacteraceae bacterium]|nr:PAS domain S-box protein [Desulfobacteraceae bacterium]